MSHDFSVWVHPICVLFTPELTVDANSLRANNLKALDQDRRGVMCCVCRRFGGSAVQCTYADCMTAAHPYCAFISGKQLVVSSVDSNSAISSDSDDKGLNYEFLCPIHQDKLNFLSGEVLSCTIDASSKPFAGDHKSKLKPASKSINKLIAPNLSPNISDDKRNSRDDDCTIRNTTAPASASFQSINVESPFHAYPTPEIPRRRYI